MVRVKARRTLKTLVILCVIAGFINNWSYVSQLLRFESHRKTTEVINPHPYKLVINNPRKCSGSDVFLLVLVTSAPENRAQRSAIRQTWGNENNVPGTVIKTLFAVGKPGKPSIQHSLEDENMVHRDIIQEDFVDSYKNLTLKTVMCLKWASKFCPSAKFVMKADDDTCVNIFNLVKRLQFTVPEEFVTGYRCYARPIRAVDDRWYVSEEEYPRETFPRYPCGFAYVMSNDITGLIYQTSLTLKYLFLEDVFLGLCLEKLAIDPVHDTRFHHSETTPSCETGKEWIAFHWIKTHDGMVKAWQDVTSCEESLS
ncbi:beta-1,3-galactosyltransferase 1-like isoform X2 [Branchiostoma floridae]|uniref:Hexosyltransferase n=1 Tax=Branchiostoma floridae TaxID=7739 RepID=A0A9J7MLU2_BRAFL|nr:beta-1,3-galactosyltransferase 1-like isoform X2 [Branchiostoma floridae]